MENNERGSDPRASGRVSSGHIRVQGEWHGNELWFRDTVVATIIPDGKYPTMWRVLLPNGELSDMVNRVRAKDAAYALAAWAANA